MFIKHPRRSGESNVSAAIMVPPENLTPRMDVPVNVGLLTEAGYLYYQFVISKNSDRQQ